MVKSDQISVHYVLKAIRLGVWPPRSVIDRTTHSLSVNEVVEDSF